MKKITKKLYITAKPRKAKSYTKEIDPKTFIEIYLRSLAIPFEKELKFHSVRRFRFDWAITSLKIAIEYEGIYSKKSRHTSLAGYTRDTEKYNLASVEGWCVLRYTASNYKNITKDLPSILKSGHKN